jgi:WD repeat-containing protein 35
VIKFLPEASPILEILGEKFQSMGLCAAAVEAYNKFGDVKRAIDCCVLLNQWNLAVELAE